jgi:23S rRNA pseudouridine1911/1915/1917 synthase
MSVPRPLPPPTAPTPLLAWLYAALAPTKRGKVKHLLQHGRVLVNGTPTTRFDHPLVPGDLVAIAAEGAAPSRHGLPVVHEDDHLVVIDKPAGLLTVATDAEKEDTAFVRLKEQIGGRGRPFVVHRLDRDTSGLLLFAKSPEVRDQLQAAWDAVSKTYLAVTDGTPRPAEGVVENLLEEGRYLRVRAVRDPTRGKRAASRHRTLAARGRFALVEVELLTGRKHQIRVHLAGLGCPVVGDPLYGSGADPAGRLGLHAWRLSLSHPVTHDRLDLEAPYPPRLARVVPLPETT